MYDTVKIGTNQKVPSADLNAMGELTRAAMGAQTRTMLVAGFKFTDFALTYAAGSFVVNVSEGFLIKGGQQYRAATATPINLVADTPPSDGLKRVVSIVGFVLPAKDDAPEQREFAVVVTPASSNAPAVYQNESRQTNTRNRQIAQVDRRTGDLGTQPNPPQLTPDLCEIARVTLTRSGIESIVIIDKNRAPNLEAVSNRVDDLDDFVDGQGRRIETLDKNLAALSARYQAPVSDAVLRQYAVNLATLNESLKTKVGDLAYRADYALDTRYSDNTYIGYAATVDDGIRFPWVASKEQPLSLFTPNDPVAKLISNLLLPDFVEEPRLVVEGMDGSLSISSQTSATVTAVKVEIPRATIKYGDVQTICSNSKEWATGFYDAAKQLFLRDGETYNVLSLNYDAPNHFWARIQKTWIDLWTETRWDKVTTQIGLNGAIRYQVFRVPDFGYIPSIELPFTVADAAFGVTLLLCEANANGPMLQRVLEKSDIPAGGIIADPNGGLRTKFRFRPAFVDPAKYYAWVTVTKGNFALATVSGNKFAEGYAGLTTDGGALLAGDPLIDFAMTVNFCRFKSPRVEIRLNDVDNVNGDVISALKFLYGYVLPTGTHIVHMARRSGGDWLPIADVTQEKQPATTGLGAGPFSAAPLPASVQQKIVLLGTTTLMPAIDLNQAWVTAQKLGNVRNHVSTPLNFGTNCNRAEIEIIVDGPFDPANHTTDAKLIVAGATVNASSSTFVDDARTPGRRIFTYGFSFPTSASARLVLPGTLASILSAYHIERSFIRAWLV